MRHRCTSSIVPHGRRGHGRALRIRASRAPRAVSRRPRSALPRHRRPVPRDDLVDARQRRRRHRPRRWSRRSPTEPVIASGTDPQDPTITVDGVDVATAIRTQEVTAAVSAVGVGARGARPAARRCSASLIGDGGIVVEGRDIGSVVWPGRRGQGLPDRRPVRPRRASYRRGERRRLGRRHRGRPAPPRRDRLRARHGAADDARRTRSTSTPRRTRSTRSSTGSWRWCATRSGRRERARHPPSARGAAPHRRSPRAAHLGAPRAGRHLPGDHPPLVRRAGHRPAARPGGRAGDRRGQPLGFIDGPLLAILAPRPVHALTKREMFTGALGPFLRQSGQIPLWRETVDPVAVRTACGSLRDGGCVGVFPEGTRGAGELTASTRAGLRTSPWSPGRRSCRWSTSAPASPAARTTRSRREGTRVVDGVRRAGAPGPAAVAAHPGRRATQRRAGPPWC